jgi:hypothetical protein
VVYDRAVTGSGKWQRAFVAVSVLVGASAEEAVALLGAGEEPEDLVRSLGAKSKAARAKALATELAVVAADVEALRWRS